MYISRPRQAVLQQWKRSLQVGDVVDASDKNGAWFEAVITAVHSAQLDSDTKVTPAANDENKLGLPGIGVHFKGWGSEFDEYITPFNVGKRIQVRLDSFPFNLSLPTVRHVFTIYQELVH